MSCRPTNKNYPRTSFDENCIEFVLQTARNFYINLRQCDLVLKLKLLNGQIYETYNSNEVEKENKKEVEKAADEEMEEEEDRVSPVTHVNTILHSIISKIEVYINNQQVYTSLDCMRASLTFPTTSWDSSLNKKNCCTARGTTMKSFLVRL